MCNFLSLTFFKHKSKIAGDFNGFEFLHRSVDGKKLMRFQSETSFFKFLAIGV